MNAQLVLLVLLFGLAFAKQNTTVTRDGDKIYNGDPAEERYRKGTALVFQYYPDSDTVFGTCTAQIVNRKWILCAAHCFWDSETDSLGFMGSQLGVIPGATFRDAREAKSNGIFVKTMYLDNRYLNNGIWDVALLELSERMPAGFTNVRFRNEPSEGTAVMAVGYGAVERDANNPGSISYSDPPSGWVPEKERIQEGRASIIDARLCFRDFGYSNFDEFDRAMVCSLYDTDTGARVCYGDSGGPIFQVRSDNQLISYGTLSGGLGCDPTNPDWYGSVGTSKVQSAIAKIRDNEVPSLSAWYTAPGNLVNAESISSYPYYELPESSSPTTPAEPPASTDTSQEPTPTPSRTPSPSPISSASTPSGPFGWFSQWAPFRF